MINTLVLSFISFFLVSLYANDLKAFYSCEKIYFRQVNQQQQFSARNLENLLETMWSLYIDMQLVASQLAVNKNSVGINNKYHILKSTWSDSLSIAQQEVPDFKNLWMDFIQKKKQSNPTTTTGRDKLLQEEVDRQKLNEELDAKYRNRKIIFHQILPGEFMMYDSNGNPVPTQITIPFGMMDTLMTQKQWATIKILSGEKDPVKINPSKFKTGAESIIEIIEGIAVEMKPNHPVESMTRKEALEMIQGLNHLSVFGSFNIQNALKKLIPDHQQGDRYDLPSEAQYEIVLRDRGHVHGKHFDKEDDSELSQYAVYGQKSTEMVASKLARLIDRGDGQRVQFFDLEGLLREWIKHDYSENIIGGKDPQGPESGAFCMARGGCFLSASNVLSVNHRSDKYGKGDDRYPGYSGHNIGLRLIRYRNTQ